MSVTIKIPTPFRKFTNGERKVEVEGETVAEALDALAATHPDIRPHVFREDGTLRADARVFVGASDIRSAQGLETAVPAGELLSIIPPVVGA